MSSVLILRLLIYYIRKQYCICFFFFFFFGVFIQNCYLFFTFSIDIQAFDTFDIKVIYMSFSKKHRKKRTNLFQSKKEREH